MDERRRHPTIGWLALGALAAVSLWLPSRAADAAPAATRIAGVDRYETAAKVSAATFSPGVPVAFIARGDDFPDALAAAPAAAKEGGPVLLTARHELPAVTAAELDRLDPGRIVVLGGTSAVLDEVLPSLQQHTAGTVTRIHGASRYETAAYLSGATFTAPVHTVYVTTGFHFPDALAGGPAAATAPSGGGPILLVEQGSLPPSVATELQRLSAQRIVVLGPWAAPNVVDDLEAYSVEPVVRRVGIDRYHTSVVISQAAFDSASTVYLTTGSNFPDGLAGGPVAGLAEAPLLLTRTDCLPERVNDEITRLGATSVVILGGPQAVSDAVLSGVECQPPPPSTLPAHCAPGYSQCLTPNAGDWDCSGGEGDGPNYVQGPFEVTGDDPFDLDPDGNGIGCEQG